MININKLEEQAVDMAINAEWEKALELNNQIIKIEPENLSAYLRNGYANLQLSNLQEAKKSYLKALDIQPKNMIAEEHLEKIEILINRKKKVIKKSEKLDLDMFIEVPGRTKTVGLVNLGQKEDLATVVIGQKVVIKEKKRKLEVRTESDDYIGVLPDDISKRLQYFINASSKYEVFIKEINLSSVVVFIKEISKGKKVKHYPSFPTNPHVMLSDINQIEVDENVEKNATVADDSEENDSDAENDDVPDLLDDDDDEETWDELEEEKDLGTIVHLEDSEDEEEDS